MCVSNGFFFRYIRDFELYVNVNGSEREKKKKHLFFFVCLQRGERTKRLHHSPVGRNGREQQGTGDAGQGRSARRASHENTSVPLMETYFRKGPQKFHEQDSGKR